MKSFFGTTAFAVGALLSLLAAPAIANGGVRWSVTVGTPGYYYYAPPPPPPVVIYPQSQFIYGAPPSVYSPPPAIYVQPPPVIPVYPQRGWENHHHGNFHQHREPPQWHGRGPSYGGQQHPRNGAMGVERWGPRR